MDWIAPARPPRDYEPEGAQPWHPPQERPDIWHDGVTAADLDRMNFPPIKWVVPTLSPRAAPSSPAARSSGSPGSSSTSGWPWRPAARRWARSARRATCSISRWRTTGDGCSRGCGAYGRPERRCRRGCAHDRVADRRRGRDRRHPALDQGKPRRPAGDRDVLAVFKGATPAKSRETLYEADYTAMKGLQSLAMATGVAIVVVHHTRKSGAEDDPFETVSGTLGLSGAADTTHRSRPQTGRAAPSTAAVGTWRSRGRGHRSTRCPAVGMHSGRRPMCAVRNSGRQFLPFLPAPPSQ